MTGLVREVSIALAALGMIAPAPRRLPTPPMAFKPAELDLAPGETYPVELFLPSATGKAGQAKLVFSPAAGLSVTPDPRWTGRLPPWGVKTYPKVTAAAEAIPAPPPGPPADSTQPAPAYQVEATLAPGGKARLTVNLVVPRLEVIPGPKRLTVRVSSAFRSRLMTGRIRASNPDRFLQDITALEFKIPPGQTQELVFPLPGAAPAESETYAFTLDVQTYQGYRAKSVHDLRFPSE